MRARRPELFSDTEPTERELLDRTTFEYHLETLTSRKQELEFEHFARKLAEKELCPNLIPQTGPTGGGDSKVDSETYPVSSEISDRWYYADAAGPEGSSQRWAFAFSAKKDWKAKVRADVKAIADVGRGYSLVYFITSRFAKDKERASIQDELQQKYGMDVRILDRTWIVEKVFTNRRERLAIETLKLSMPLVPVLKKGPKDTTREKELQELEGQITDPDRYKGLDYQLVEDSMRGALLARALELPRVEVEGRLERASRLAEQRGTKQQQLACAYNKAWTYFWWYDDFASFNKAYDAVEELVLGSPQVTDIELLHNLWHLAYGSVRAGQIQLADAQLAKRTEFLRNELKRLKEEKGRPSAALHATATLLLMDLVEALGKAGKLKGVLNDFQQVFDKSKGLVNFPAVQFIEILMELGEQFPDDAQFDELFEAVLRVAKERESSVVSGRMLLRRGTQKLKASRPYEAIRLLGRAQQHLAVRESRGEMVAALAICAAAYEAAGLPWAARGALLVGAHMALHELWERSTITGQALACLKRLIWIELQLGRVPCALAWLEATMLATRAAAQDEDREKRLAEELTDIDRILGLLLLKAELFDLKNLGFLPGVLERMGLTHSWIALLYALGYEDKLRSDEAIPPEETQEELLALMGKWVTQPAASDLQRPEFLDKRTITLRSTVMGCEVIATVPNNNRSLFLAEAVLAALEAFLATSLNLALVPHTPRLQVKITPSDFISGPLDFTVTTAPDTLIEVRHPPGDSAGAENADAFKDKLVELISTITAYMTVIPEGSKEFLEEVVKNELGFGRALMLAGVQTIIGGILGDKPKLRIYDWDTHQGREELFPLRREEAWNQSLGQEQPSSRPPTWGSGDPPPALFEEDHLKHRDRKVFSLINIELWNKAGWTATAFITSDRPDEPPYLALVFKDREAAASIFAGWRNEIGKQDSGEKLRVSMLTGIDRENPSAYRVIIGINPDLSTVRPGGQAIVVSRIHTMHPNDSSNLDRFLASYKQRARYILLPAQAGPNNSFVWAPELGILKHELVVRPAYQIGENDPDVCAIDADDKVIIPDGVREAPILRTMERIRGRRSRQVGDMG